MLNIDKSMSFVCHFIFSDIDAFERKAKIIEYTKNASDDELMGLFAVLTCIDRGYFYIKENKEEHILRNAVYTVQSVGVASRMVTLLKADDDAKKKISDYIDIIYQKYGEILDSCHNCQNNYNCDAFKKYMKDCSIKRKCDKYDKNIELLRGVR